MNARPPELPPLAHRLTTTFLTAVDEEAPGLVEGLYLTGSVALGEFRPHTSDVDFVAVTAARPDTAGVAALERAHARVRAAHRRPYFDGPHVTWADLARDPATVEPAPFAHDGNAVAVGDFELNPPNWHVLARHGIACRGPEVSELDFWDDPAVLASWTRGNLDAYWRPWHARASRPTALLGAAMLSTAMPVWGVLGVTRLHYTLATGTITSKEGAGVYALDRFPSRWHRILHECLRVRRGDGDRSRYRTPVVRRREALDYMAMVLADTAP